ncbi:MAG: flagellar export protein FliJ [Syntrophobacterales bacterium]|nr:MAG: flagellar export protein FliJ [Syntrophobacterales bacterium]
MFKFRLQPVLDYRENIEEDRRVKFAEIKRALDAKWEELNAVRKEKQALVSRLENSEDRMQAADVSVYLSYICSLKDTEARHVESVRTLERKLGDARADLVEATKQCKVLEMVKEKRLKEYRIFLSGRERKEMDEVGIAKSSVRV